MKHNSNASPVQSKVFMMYIEGDPATVQKAVEAAQRTLTGPGSSVRASIGTPTPPRVALPAPVVAAGEVSRQDEVEEDLDELEQVQTSAKDRRPRSFRPLDVLDDLKANEEPSFNSYVNGRAITPDVERGLVAAMWLKEKRTIVEFTKRHLHTCFAMMNWNMPDDPGSLLRNMKKAQYVRSIVGKLGTFELTTVGTKRYSEL